MFNSLDGNRRKRALWRYDYDNQIRPHSSLGTPAEARQTLKQFNGSAPGALAQTNTNTNNIKTKPTDPHYK